MILVLPRNLVLISIPTCFIVLSVKVRRMFIPFTASMLREWKARLFEPFLENASMAQDTTNQDVSDANPPPDAVF